MPEPRLIPVEEVPFNAETPLEALIEPVTPAGLVYVRTHFDIPRIDPAAWRLAVNGLVDAPASLSLAALTGLPGHTITVTMECAGNGRRLLTPLPPGTPWGLGAVSTATFVGASLGDVLDLVHPHDEADQVLFTGVDHGAVDTGGQEPFGRALPLAVARHPDTLLAWEMNGAPLTAPHGAPLRLVVPGWYGMASVKWLTRIHLQRGEFAGYFQRDRYVYVDEEGTPDGTPVTLMRVRAVIARPAEGATLERGEIEIAGVAWSGAGAISRVEVSTDTGASWNDADLSPSSSRYASTAWRYRWHPARPGPYMLAARAWDRAGSTQPLTPRWNLHGYGNNVVQRLAVTVV